MTLPPFLHGHATHPDWRMALSLALAQVDAQATRRAHAARPADPASDSGSAAAADTVKHPADAPAPPQAGSTLPPSTPATPAAQPLPLAAGQPSDPTLGWCYLSDHYAASAEAIHAELQRRCPGVAWVGVTAVGVAASGVEYLNEPALVLMLADLPRECFRIFNGPHPLPPAESGFEAHTALVHADPSTPELEELLAELAPRTATGYLFGGLASARHRARHIAGGVWSGGLSGVAFDRSVQLISRITQGCQPIGPARVITEADRNVVVSLDGEPALDCLLRDLGAADAPSHRELLPRLRTTLAGLSSGAADAIRRPGQFGTDTRVRHLIGLEPQRRGLAVAEEVDEGMQLAFCTRNPQAARRDLVRIATEIREEVEGDGEQPPRRMLGALYISCAGRGGPHFGGEHAELQALQHALGELPLAGFFAGGEIARDQLYGYTGVLTVFVA